MYLYRKNENKLKNSIKRIFCKHKLFELIMYRKRENKPHEFRCINCGYTTLKIPDINKLKLRKNG